MRTIASRQNAVVREYRALAATPDPSGARLLLDGLHLIQDARQAGLVFESIAIAARQYDDDGAAARLARALDDGRTDVIVADAPVLDAMSPVRSPSGVVAIARRVPLSPATVCDAADFVIVACDVQDPGNLGSLARAAEAGGAGGLLVCGDSAHPFSWKALRGSMGSLLRLPVATTASAAAAFDCLHAAGARTVAAVPRGGHAPDAVDWRGPVGLLLGGEGAGLPPAVAEACDARVTIPMAAPVESLNVAVAGAVLVYAARRQREEGA